MTLRGILLLISIVLFILAGCGIGSWTLGSVTLNTGWFGLAFFAASFFPK